MNLLFFIIAISLLPFFRSGYFWDAEIQPIILLLSAPFLGLTTKIKKPDLLVITYIFLLIISIISLFFHNQIWMDIFGTPQTRFSAIYLISMIYILTFVNRSNTYSLTCSYMFLFIFLIINILSHPDHNFLYLDNVHPYAFTAIFGALALLPLSILLKQHPHSLQRTILLGGLVFIIYMSANKTLIIGGLVLTPIYLICKKIQIQKWHALLFCTSLPFLIIIAEYVAYIQDPTLSKFLFSISSRFITLKSVFHAFYEQPLKLLYGFGFGKSGEIVEQYLTQLPITLVQNGVYNPSWDGVDRIEFHCYHGLVEMLLSTGILGATVFLGIWLIPIISSDKKSLLKNTFLTSLWILHQSMWFLLPIQWVFDAFFLRTLTPNNKQNLGKRSGNLIKCSSICLIILGMYLSHMLMTFNRVSTPFTQLFPTSLSTIDSVSLYKNIPTLGYAIHDDIQNDDIDDNTIRDFLTITKNLPDLPLITIKARLKSFEYIASKNTAYDIILDNHWKRDTLNMLAMFPHRYDLIFPYLLYTSTFYSKKKFNYYNIQLLKANPQNPTLLWFFQKNNFLPLDQKEKNRDIEKWVPINKLYSP